jgi:hypothetical protein
MGPQGLSSLWSQESSLDNMQGLTGAVHALSLSFDIILHCFVYLIEIFQPFFQWDMVVLYHAVWFTLDSQQLSSYIV